MAETRRIDELQNNARSLLLFRAIAVAHSYTQRAQTASLLMSLVVASLGVVAKVAQPALQPAASVVGALWAGVYAVVLAPQIGRHLRTSATLQEMLDTDLFGLPWNAVLVGERLSEDELSRLSRRYRGDDARLRDYYLVATVVAPYDVLFCLEQNLAWGSRVRRRFAAGLLGVVAVWCAGGVAVGLLTESTVASLVSVWFVPSLGLLLACSDMARAQILTTQDRIRVLGLVRARMEESSRATADDQAFAVFARQVQDVLFVARRQQPRMPQWFFRLFHDDDLADFRYKMQVLEQRVGVNS
ncbi:S-4TM family putative pore-forming effector [Micromonospora sp. NPDC049101]|uniref:S-4TM family putative pore-forming effector n=1 Tax=Micromonospora sp. NPDC049101 TaxID=3155032 RepID=UPI0033DCBC1B